MSEGCRDRDDLLDDLVGIITAGLASRSDSELESLIRAFQEGQVAGLEALPSANGAVMVQVDPTATKVAVASALDEMREWVDANWDSARLRMTGITIPMPEGPDVLN